MFSQELVVKMADGSTKNSNQIVIGDYILDTFRKPALVTNIITSTNSTSYSVSLSNSNGNFYVLPTQKIRVNLTTNGNKLLIWDTFTNAYNNNSCIRNNRYLFSGCGIHISSFTQDNTPRTLYKFVLKNCNNFYGNNIIFKTCD